MATANDLMIRARRRVGIHADEEPYDAASQARDFDTLTDMLGQWVIDDLIKSYSATAYAATVTLTFDDDTTLTDEANLAILAGLAVKMAGDYGLPLTPDIVADAEKGYAMLAKKQVLANQAEQSSYDKALSTMPSQRRGNWTAYDGSA